MPNIDLNELEGIKILAYTKDGEAVVLDINTKQELKPEIYQCVLNIVPAYKHEEDFSLRLDDNGNPITTGIYYGTFSFEFKVGEQE